MFCAGAHFLKLSFSKKNVPLSAQVTLQVKLAFVSKSDNFNLIFVQLIWLKVLIFFFSKFLIDIRYVKKVLNFDAQNFARTKKLESSIENIFLKKMDSKLFENYFTFSKMKFDREWNSVKIQICIEFWSNFFDPKKN